MQNDSLLLDLDARFRVNGQCHLERFLKGRLDLPHPAEARTKLGMDCGPSHRCWLRQGVEPISKPDIDIDGERPGANRSQSFFPYGNRMFFQ